MTSKIMDELDDPKVYKFYRDTMFDLMEIAGWNVRDKSPTSLPKQVTIKI